MKILNRLLDISNHVLVSWVFLRGLALIYFAAFASMVYAYRWLIARFMLMAGVVKLASGDPAWVNLTGP